MYVRISLKFDWISPDKCFTVVCVALRFTPVSSIQSRVLSNNFHLSCFNWLFSCFALLSAICFSLPRHWQFRFFHLTLHHSLQFTCCLLSVCMKTGIFCSLYLGHSHDTNFSAIYCNSLIERQKQTTVKLWVRQNISFSSLHEILINISFMQACFHLLLTAAIYSVMPSSCKSSTLNRKISFVVTVTTPRGTFCTSHRFTLQWNLLD